MGHIIYNVYINLTLHFIYCYFLNNTLIGKGSQATWMITKYIFTLLSIFVIFKCKGMCKFKSTLILANLLKGKDAKLWT